MSGAGEGVMGASMTRQIGFAGEKQLILNVAKIRLRDCQKSLKDFQEGHIILLHDEELNVLISVRLLTFKSCNFALIHSELQK